jgi:hypothetical protein
MFRNPWTGTCVQFSSQGDDTAAIEVVRVNLNGLNQFDTSTLSSVLWTGLRPPAQS